MLYNRASYQPINGNMSLKKTVAPKRPFLLFKNKEGLTFTKAVTASTLRMIAKHNIKLTSTDILIDLLHGNTFRIANGVSVTLTFK
jgi:hypothetical protein